MSDSFDGSLTSDEERMFHQLNDFLVFLIARLFGLYESALDADDIEDLREVQSNSKLRNKSRLRD